MGYGDTDTGERRGIVRVGRFAELEDALCERVAELRRERPLERLTVVVGSADVRTRVGDLLVRRLEAIANLEVVTLDRLARELASGGRVEAGGAGGEAPPAVLTSLARERLVRRLLAEHAPRLVHFGPVVDRPHFARALAATFADLREAAVEPRSAWAEAFAAADGPGGSARARAADLDRLYGAYCDELRARGLLDDAAVYAAATAALGGRARSGRVILYGLYDVNQVQEALVAALVAGGADVLIPLPSGAATDALTILPSASAGRPEPRPAEPSGGQARDREAVAAVWAARDPAGRVLVGDGSLAVLSVPDERAETREAVRAVLAAAQAGVPFRECAVVVAHGDDVERFAGAFEAAGIPVACRLPDRTPGSRALVRLLDCLAPDAGEPFARRAVVDFLAAARAGVDAAPAAVALWLDEARQAGVVCGRDQWLERMRRRVRGLERKVADRRARDADEDADDEDAEGLRVTEARLAAARGLDAAVRALARAGDSLPPHAAWGAWADALGGIVVDLLTSDVGAAARDVVGRLRPLAALGEEVDIAEVAAALRELLADQTRSLRRVGRDGVAVLTPLEVRGLAFRTVVFAGLAEGGFPGRGRPDPILGDADRRRIAEALGVRIKLAEQRDAESLLLFGFVCEAAGERLILVSPRTDAATGRPRLPSRLLLRLASLVAGHPVGLDEFLSGAPLAPVWRRASGAPGYAADVLWVDERERDVAALLALSARGPRCAAREYLAAVVGEGVATRRLGAWHASRSPEVGPWDGLLGGEARAALQARHPFAAELHPTALERYVRCPFSFLLRDVVGLEEPREPDDELEMDRREFGTLAHAILERVYARVIADDLDRDAALAVVDDAWSLCCVEAEGRGLTGAALVWEVVRGTLRDDLRECVRRDAVFTAAGGRPAGVEWRFGEAVGRPVALELDDGRGVRFAGRLDRIDVTPAGVRVIDYKTGSGFTESERIKGGLSVQLSVYELAVRQTAGELGLPPDDGRGQPLTVTSLYRLVTRRGGFRDLAPTDGQAFARLRNVVTRIVALVDAGLFPRTTAERCEYCDVAYACGVSAWARSRKRTHETLAPVVALQKPTKEGAGGS